MQLRLRCGSGQRVVMAAHGCPKRKKAPQAQADVVLHRLHYHYVLPGWENAQRGRATRDEYHEIAQSREWADAHQHPHVDFDNFGADRGFWLLVLGAGAGRETRPTTAGRGRRMGDGARGRRAGCA